MQDHNGMSIYFSWTDLFNSEVIQVSLHDSRPVSTSGRGKIWPIIRSSYLQNLCNALSIAGMIVGRYLRPSDTTLIVKLKKVHLKQIIQVLAIKYGWQNAELVSHFFSPVHIICIKIKLYYSEYVQKGHSKIMQSE